MKLPDGYDTIPGERGNKLSSSQGVNHGKIVFYKTRTNGLECGK